jgi:NAD(P)-dependent dehydrogenase (short-subunit alcohol dehydrogenase family)
VKPFLELPEDVFSSSIDVSARGGFHFSQATLPLLLRGVEQKPHYPPSLIFTGATASIKSSAKMAAFSTGKWAVRALSQSLAKEFGPQGVHVAHAVIDGVIDIPKSKEYLKHLGPEAKLSPDEVGRLLSTTQDLH